MTDRRGSDDDIARLLRQPVWAVVGLTPNPRRASYGVGRFLLDHGVAVIPVNPSGAAVHGRPGVATLSEIDVPVDVVDIFRRSDQAGAHVDEAIAIGAGAVWLQLGVIDTAAADRAHAAGLSVVMDHCPAIEWPRLGPSPLSPRLGEQTGRQRHAVHGENRCGQDVHVMWTDGREVWTRDQFMWTESNDWEGR